MSGRVLGGIVLVGIAVALWRTFGFIRMEPPMSEQREGLFKSDGPKYRRTQEANRWRLRITNPRTIRRRKSA